MQEGGQRGRKRFLSRFVEMIRCYNEMSTTNMANDNQTASNTTADAILSSQVCSLKYISRQIPT